jgi:quaternary ammonium compound-resistance protein SugE
MVWIELLFAGVFEFIWATTLKLSEGFSKLNYSVLTVLGMGASFYLLAKATKVLPLSLAYPIWTGIGAIGSIVIGVVLFKDTIAPLTWVFIVLLLIGLIGMKVTSGH